uniref:Uncharacterized protein n=1 Tax=Rhodnius prolixus TaxID=13249 RepID=T1HG39_RHOPR
MSGIWRSVWIVWLLTFRMECLLYGGVFWIGVFLQPIDVGFF